MKPGEEPRCEACGSWDVAEIVHGLVTSDVEAEYPGRRIVLGGCVVEATSPAWQCLACGRTWGRAFSEEGPGSISHGFGQSDSQPRRESGF